MICSKKKVLECEQKTNCISYLEWRIETPEYVIFSKKNRFWNANKRPIVSRISRYNWSFVRIPEPILFRKDHVFWGIDSSFETRMTNKYSRTRDLFEKRRFWTGIRTKDQLFPSNKIKLNFFRGACAGIEWKNILIDLGVLGKTRLTLKSQMSRNILKI